MVEAFHGRLRDERLDREIVGSVEECEVLLEDFRRQYNEERPHSALGYLPPAVYAERAMAMQTSRGNQA